MKLSYPPVDLVCFSSCVLCCVQIVITGVGSLSSVGIGTDSHYQALLEGKSGIETLPEWAEEYPCKVRHLGGNQLHFHGSSIRTWPCFSGTSSITALPSLV